MINTINHTVWKQLITINSTHIRVDQSYSLEMKKPVISSAGEESLNQILLLALKIAQKLRLHMY